MSEEMAFCPYNNAHKMHRKRLIPHMIKCKSLHPNVELRTCPLNSIHVMREEELAKHIATCPDRKTLTDYLNGSAYEEEERTAQLEVDSTENWDDGTEEDDKPQQIIRKSTILQQPVGRPAERRAILKHEAEIYVDKFPKTEDNAEEDSLNEPLIKKEKRLEIKFNRIKVRERMQRTDLEEVKDELITCRPLTPPPPSGIDWKANRDRSRSPPIN